MPGPGTYDQKSSLTKDGPAWGQGTSKRDAGRSKDLDSSPAPGSYSPLDGSILKNGPKIGFGVDKRRGTGEGNSSLNPGPGNYNIDSVAFNNRNPRFHMGQKLPPIKGTTDNPGAGSYSP